MDCVFPFSLPPSLHLPLCFYYSARVNQYDSGIYLTNDLLAFGVGLCTMNVYLSYMVPCDLKDQVHLLPTNISIPIEMVPFSFEGQVLRYMHSLPFWTVSPSGPNPCLISFRSSFQKLAQSSNCGTCSDYVG